VLSVPPAFVLSQDQTLREDEYRLIQVNLGPAISHLELVLKGRGRSHDEVVVLSGRPQYSEEREVHRRGLDV
jgi:hypothetical protein